MLTVPRGRSIFRSLVKYGIHRQPALVNLRSFLRLNSSAVDWNTVHAGKVAVMTASTEGIAFAIARRLAQQGTHVVVSSRKQENVDKAIKQLKSENLSVSGTICSVANKDHRKNLVELALEKYGRIDYLLSNAAAGLDQRNIFDTTEEEWTEVLHTNVTVAFLLVKEVLPHMQNSGGGSIVLTSSAAAYTFYPGLITTLADGILRHKGDGYPARHITSSIISYGTSKTAGGISVMFVTEYPIRQGRNQAQSVFPHLLLISENYFFFLVFLTLEI